MARYPRCWTGHATCPTERGETLKAEGSAEMKECLTGAPSRPFSPESCFDLFLSAIRLHTAPALAAMPGEGEAPRMTSGWSEDGPAEPSVNAFLDLARDAFVGPLLYAVWPR